MPLASPSFLRMFMTNEVTPLMDVLESRRLLAGASLSNGLLTVNGTDSRDIITVFIERKNPKNLDVKINSSVKAFTLATVKSMSIKGADGNDSISVDEAFGPINIPVTVFAGSGNDIVTTASGAARIYLGVGNDTAVGGAGPDRIYGENGDDNIFGGDGNDYIDGGDGNDSLDGEGGNDRVFGGIGDDSINGSEGNNTLFGGDGMDTLTGGGGVDSMSGDAGDDLLLGGSGGDVMSGGNGNDSILGNEGS